MYRYQKVALADTAVSTSVVCTRPLKYEETNHLQRPHVMP